MGVYDHIIPGVTNSQGVNGAKINSIRQRGGERAPINTPERTAVCVLANGKIINLPRPQPPPSPRPHPRPGPIRPGPPPGVPTPPPTPRRPANGHGVLDSQDTVNNRHAVAATLPTPQPPPSPRPRPGPRPGPVNPGPPPGTPTPPPTPRRPMTFA